MLADGELERRIAQGVRGITSNPTIFAKAMAASDAYDAELAEAIGRGLDVESAYWQLARSDVASAAELLAPVYESSGGADGFVSIEVDPRLAHETEATVAMGRELFGAIGRPNVMIKVPATVEGLPAITELIAGGVNVNVTLIFSLERHLAVMEAYLAGLEARSAPLARVASVASFFVSRVDSDIDGRLDDLGTAPALALRGRAAVAQARAAYANFAATFAGSRWDALAARGAHPQRPLWASTSTKNPSYPDTLYVDSLIGPHTVNTLPDATLDAFVDHGVAARTVDADPAEAQATLRALADAGIDLDAVTAKLEAEGVAAFVKSLDEVFATLQHKVDALSD